MMALCLSKKGPQNIEELEVINLIEWKVDEDRLFL